MQHKLHKDVKRKLSEMIKDLPVMTWNTREVRKLIPGKELLKANPEMKDRKDEPIDPKRSYHVLVNPPVDHKAEIEREYKKGGMDGAEKYIQWVRDMDRQQEDEEIAAYRAVLMDKIAKKNGEQKSEETDAESAGEGAIEPQQA